MRKYILVKTDGYSIKVVRASQEKNSLTEQLRQIYRERTPNGRWDNCWDDELKKQSYSTDTDAILYDGYDVYV